MAAHYGSAVMPARVRTPRDKPSVGNEVWQAANEIGAALRSTAFTDLNALKRAVSEKLEEHNARPFSKREGSRRQVFEEQERPLLMPLPAVAYEVCTWVCERRVQRSCHVAHKRNFYSVSHLAVGRTVDLHVTDSTVEVFLGGERLSTHPLLPACARNRCTTHGGRPARRAVLLRLGRGTDPQVGRSGRPTFREVVDRIFQRVDCDEYGFNAALVVLRLSHKYPGARLERACAMVLAAGKRSLRYRDVKLILSTNKDKVVDARGGDDGGPGADEAGCVRGVGFYGEEA